MTRAEFWSLFHEQGNLVLSDSIRYTKMQLSTSSSSNIQSIAIVKVQIYY